MLVERKRVMLTVNCWADKATVTGTQKSAVFLFHFDGWPNDFT